MNLHEVKPTMPWGLYPDEWDQQIDCIEVHGVKDISWPGSDTTECEMWDEEGTADFWSAYGHLGHDGGVTVLGDFQTFEEALAAAHHLSKLHNIPWDNYYPA